MSDQIDCNALWLDPLKQAADFEKSRLAEAGIRLLPVRTLDDLRRALNTASMLVIRLAEGSDLLHEIRCLMRGFKQDLPIVCRVSSGALATTAQAMRMGACHVVDAEDFSVPAWVHTLELVRLHARQASQPPAEARAAKNRSESDAAEARSSEPRSAEPRSAEPTHSRSRVFVFADPHSQALVALARKVAQAQVTTLITGPTGAGKEVLATVIHEASPRVNGPFVAVNCGAIPENLMEDTLFGHERGAFTGALNQHRGIFEQAQGGTVFLDEIGELPMTLQAKLLRVLQERKLTRLGGQGVIEVDFRLIAATNKDLRAAVQAREFREDLYFRISTFKLAIPALKDRPMDILPLALQAIDRHAQLQGRHPVPELSEDGARALLSYPWPGNVRELDNVIQRALVLSQGGSLESTDLIFDEDLCPQTCLDWGLSTQLVAPRLTVVSQGTADELEPLSSMQPIRLHDAVKSNEHQMILRAIESAPTKAEAAKRLGISPRTLRYKMAQLKMAGAA